MVEITLVLQAAIGILLTLVCGFTLANAVCKGKPLEPLGLASLSLVLGLLVPPLVLLGVNIAIGLKFNDYVTVLITYLFITCAALVYWKI